MPAPAPVPVAQLAHRRRATAPFDLLASRYDALFTHTPLGRALRRRTWRAFEAAFPPGGRLLDLGCGTGADAVHLASRGYRVHGIDASPAMVALAREGAGAARVDGSEHGATFAIWPLEELDRMTGHGVFDGAYANFGSLNCVADLGAFGRALASLLVPGASFVAVVMGPLCPWEWAYYLARLRPRTAARRLAAGGATAVLGSDTAVPRRPGTATAMLGATDLPGAATTVRYPSPASLARRIGAAYELVATHSLGLFLPPTYAAAVVTARPRLMGALAALDDLVGPLGAGLGDHYIAHFVRQPGGPGGR